MMYSNRHFLFLVLALLATSFHASDAFSFDGLLGELGGGKGGKGGGAGGKGGNKDEGGKGGGKGGNQDEDEVEVEDEDAEMEEGPTEFSWMNLVCFTDNAYPIVDTICQMGLTFAKSQLGLDDGDDEEVEAEAEDEEEDVTSTLVLANPQNRKLRGLN